MAGGVNSVSPHEYEPGPPERASWRAPDRPRDTQNGRRLHVGVPRSPPLQTRKSPNFELLLASLQCHFALDSRVVPDLCHGLGIQPALGPGRNAAAPVRPPAVGSAIEQASARPRTAALEPAFRRTPGPPIS